MVIRKCVANRMILHVSSLPTRGPFTVICTIGVTKRLFLFSLFFFFFCIFPSFYEKISGIYLRDRSITRVSMIENMLVRSNLDSLWSCFLLLLSLSRVVDDL